MAELSCFNPGASGGGGGGSPVPPGTGQGEIVFWDTVSAAWKLSNIPTDKQVPVFDVISGDVIYQTIPQVPVGTGQGEIVFWDTGSSTYKLSNIPTDQQIPVFDSATGDITFTTFPRVVSFITTPAITANPQTTDEIVVTAQATAITLNAWAGVPKNGQMIVYRLKDNGIPQAITYDVSFRPVGTTLNAITTAGKVMYITCIYNSDDATVDVIGVQQE